MKNQTKSIKAKKRLPLSRFSIPYNGIINIVYAENELMAANQVVSRYRKYGIKHDHYHYVDNNLLYA